MSVLVAKDTFAGPNMRIVTQGEMVDSTDPIVQGREQLFETVEEAAARPSEVIHYATPADVEEAPVEDEPAPKRASRK